MTDTPWSGDAISLVDAFRNGERSPLEELDATLAAIESSDLNAFSHLDPEPARKAAANADVSQPFGGVPIGVKELDHVAGWPARTPDGIEPVGDSAWRSERGRSAERDH